MQSSEPSWTRQVLATAWIATASPFVVSGVWVPIARGLGVETWSHFAVVLAAMACMLIPCGLRGRVPSAWLDGGGVVAATVAAWALVGADVGAPLLAALLAAAAMGTHRLSAWMAARLPPSLDEPSPVWARVLWGVAMALAFASAVRVGAFMGDPSLWWCSVLPGHEMLERHACMSGYLHAALLVADGANPYDLRYDLLELGVNAPLPDSAAFIAPFSLDVYAYSPAFLLVSEALLCVSHDFISLRGVFAMVSMLSWCVCVWAVGETLGGVTQQRMAWLAPLLTASPPLLFVLQLANFHLVLVAMCAAIWLALYRRREAWAGALLAAAVLAKYSPALLGVYLLGRRRLKVLAFTAVAALGLIGLSVGVHGVRPWEWFFTYQIPNIQSGVVMGFLDTLSSSVMSNLAPFGVPFKLRELGLKGMGWEEARSINQVFTVFLVVVAVWASRRRGCPPQELASWLAVAMLAALRSPFAGPHILCGLVLPMLVLVGEVRGRRQACIYGATLAAFMFPWPHPGPVGYAWWLVLQVLLLGVLVWMALLPSGDARQAAAGGEPLVSGEEGAVRIRDA